MLDRPDKPAGALPSNLWPLLLAVAVAAVGVVLISIGSWRKGPVVIAAALWLAAFLRLVLPDRIAGLLVVRRRWIDVTGMVLLGGAIAVLALVVPGTP